MNGDEPRPGFNRQEALEAAAQQIKINLATFEVNARRMLEQTRAGNEAGTEAIKAVTLINGGAAVAVLAFVGHLASIHATSATIMNFVRPLNLFVWGVLMGVVASAVVYFTHLCYFNGLEHEFAATTARDENKPTLAKTEDQASTRWNRTGRWGTNPVAVLCGVASLCLFAIGCSEARHAFESRTITSSTEDQPSFRGIF